MLRVLHVIYDDPANPWVAGGGAVRVFELYRHLAGRVDATVATGNYPGARDETIDGVRYLRLGARGPYAWSRLTYAAAANRLLRTAEYDAAVFDFSTYTPVFVPTDRPAGITVHHVSGPTARERWGPVLGPGIGQVEKRMIRRAARLSATSLATRALLEQIAPHVPIDMVYAGVPDELFAVERKPEEYLLYFGRLDVFQKGLDTLLEAFALLVRTRPGLELRIAGRGKDAERVAAHARELGVDRNVRMLGAVSEADRQALFAGAAVELMPSRFEGFGMVAAEAMAAGVPLVAAAAGSLPEVVDAPRGGVLVPPGDAAALAEATARLLDDRAAREALSASARISAGRYRWEAVAADHLQFIERISRGRAASPPRPDPDEEDRSPAPPRQRAGRPADTELPMRLGIAAAVFLVLSLLYFFPAFLPGRQVYGTDYLAGSYFFYDFFADRFGAGTLPKWVPYIYGGMPVYANPGSAYHPVHLLAETLLPTGKVIGAIFVVQFWLAGLGMYLLARELGCRAWVAFVAGIAFQFTGVTMSWVYAGHDGRIMVSTMAPLFFYFLHRGIRTGTLAPFAGAAGTLGFALLSFQIQNSYYLILAGFIWAVFLLFRFGLHRRPAALAKTVAYGFGAIAFAFLLASVNFLPFRDYVGESPRGMEGGRGYEYSVSYSMPPVGLVSMAVPEHAGASIIDPETQRPLFPPNAGFKLHTEYVGALVMVLLAIGVAFAWRVVYWRFFAGLALFALSMALGGNTPLYRLYYNLLPGLDRFRAPDLAYYVAAFSLVAMAALTLERLAELRAASAARRVGAADDAGLRKVLWIGLGVAGIGVLGAMMAGGETGIGEPSRAAGWMRFALFAGAVTAILWGWTAGKMRSMAAALLLALVTLTDLWIVDRRFFHTTDGPETAFAADDVVTFLAAQPGPNRVWALPVPQAWGRGGPSGGDYPMLHGIEQAGGEHPNPLQRWVQYAGAGRQVITDWHNFMGPVDSLRATQSPDGEALLFTPRPGFLEAANIRYVVSMVPMVHPTLREVHRGSALVYENTAALPRAYLVPAVQKLPEDRILPAMLAGGWNPARTAFVPADAPVNVPAGPLTGGARVTAYGPDRVTVRTTASRPALMVLADNFYAGWRATVNGRETPIVRTNSTFRGVMVPAGTHNVEFVFHPDDLYTGFYLYLAGFALLAAFAVFLLIRHRRHRTVAVAAEPVPAA